MLDEMPGWLLSFAMKYHERNNLYVMETSLEGTSSLEMADVEEGIYKTCHATERN